MLSVLADTSGDAAPLLYTHGFYIDFGQGMPQGPRCCRKTPGFWGGSLWFSWPSDGSLLNYTHDEADLYWSVLDLAETIIMMQDHFGSGRVNLAGHSLRGSRHCAGDP